VASPKFGLWWVLWVRVCSWLVRAPKLLQLHTTNLLFGLCRSVWVIDFLVNLPSRNPRAPTHPSTPKVLRAREHVPTPSSIVFTFGLAVESIKELMGASFIFFTMFCWYFFPFRNVFVSGLVNTLFVFMVVLLVPFSFLHVFLVLVLLVFSSSLCWSCWWSYKLFYFSSTSCFLCLIIHVLFIMLPSSSS
jgi:hypothetical protein